ncbi:deoxynucleoside kinase [Piscinibacter sp. XHJ-5]|uniref:deoxynucleoside kinase n=1 Tax=Piscinibacter sp. XHJ-5 TaxID=3037797 RepID=UPI002452D3F9|nr:deoxynucleoside kinase [Piscinibacter sp. XHJ-5]
MAGLLERFRHIAIEGPIGVGKSSLARKLGAHLGADLLLEKPQDNPFLGRFYDDTAGYAFQTQLFFLFQRVRQMQQLAQPGMFARGVVSDFLFDKDALFARLNLSDDEYRQYATLHAQVAPQVPEPDLVVWLQAAPATLLQRIRRRGIAMEQHIGDEYLQRLCDAYVEHFHAYAGAPVFTVVTEHFNPLERPADFALLIERLAAFEGPRGVLDPGAADTLATP